MEAQGQWAITPAQAAPLGPSCGLSPGSLATEPRSGGQRRPGGGGGPEAAHRSMGTGAEWGALGRLWYHGQHKRATMLIVPFPGEKKSKPQVTSERTV